MTNRTKHLCVMFGTTLLMVIIIILAVNFWLWSHGLFNHQYNRGAAFTFLSTLAVFWLFDLSRRDGERRGLFTTTNPYNDGCKPKD